MGKLDVTLLRYLTRDDYRSLTAVEMGMRNHAVVPGPLIAQLANIQHGRVYNKLYELSKQRLTAVVRGKNFDGYRLTNKGYDYLSLNVLVHRGVVKGFGTKIGVGKESDIYTMQSDDDKVVCMKIHRLGRVCFRKLKEKRDYLGHRTNSSWLYFSRLSATKEYAFMKVLYEQGFPVPKPLDMNRHIIIMEIIHGYPLASAQKVEDPGSLYSDLMNLIIKLANHGVIHCDFNEFNIMIGDDHRPILIDFPQMVSIEHENAEMYFQRDVNCIRDLFKRKFNFQSESYPVFGVDTKRVGDIDKQLKASGYANEIMQYDQHCWDAMASKESHRVEDEDESEYEEDEDIEEEDEDIEEESDEIDEENEDIKENRIPLPKESSTSPSLPHGEGSQFAQDNLARYFQDISVSSEIKEELATPPCSFDPVQPNSQGQDMEGPSDNQSVVSTTSTKKRCDITADDRKRIIKEINKASIIMRQAAVDEKEVPTYEDIIGNNLDDILSVASFTTSASRYDPKVVQTKLRFEAEKKAKRLTSRKSKQVKGKANAHNRTQKDLNQTIKELQE